MADAPRLFLADGTQVEIIPADRALAGDILLGRLAPGELVPTGWTMFDDHTVWKWNTGNCAPPTYPFFAIAVRQVGQDG